MFYPNPETVTDYLIGDPSFPIDSDPDPDTVPVLAFWRIDPIEDGDLPSCDSSMTTDVLQECELLRIRQAAYTLVVYAQRINDETDSTWSGQSRIIRYELTKVQLNYSSRSNHKRWVSRSHKSNRSARLI